MELKIKEKFKNKSIFSPQFKIEQIFKKLLNEKLINYEKIGYISKLNDQSQPYFNSAIFANFKKNNQQDIREIIDYRKVNKILEKVPQDGIPKIDDIIFQMRNKKYFTKLDLICAYHQVEINIQDRKITTFTNPFNNIKYVWNVVPYGLSVVPGMFQNLISGIIGPEVINYLDDVIIAHEDELTHVKEIIRIIKIFNDYKIKINIEKSKLIMKKIKLLGYIISNNKIELDKNYLVKLKNFKKPENQVLMRKFLGACNYIRRFIPRYSTIFSEFEKLRYENFKWNKNLEDRYNTIMEIFSEAPVLTMPDFEKTFYLATDASGVGIGGFLFQLQEDKTYTSESKINIISFNSRSLSPTERLYTTPRKECLSIVYNLQYYRPWLYGRKFFILTDNQAIAFLLENDKSNGLLNKKLISYISILMEYDFEIILIKGRINKLPDKLSRLYDNDNNNNNNNNISFYYVENSEEIKKKIKTAHEFGHFGTNFMFSFLINVMKINMDKNELYKLIKEETNNCQACYKFNKGKSGFNILKPVLAEYPLKEINMDIKSIYNHSNRGHVAVLILVDNFTRYCWIRPLLTKKTNEIIENLENIMSEFGIFEEIRTDNDPAFTSKSFTIFKDIFEIKMKFSAPSNPQSNGLAESFCKIIGNSINKMCEELKDKNDWDLILPKLQFSLNCKTSNHTGSTPFSLLFGRLPFNPKGTDKPLLDAKSNQEMEEKTKEVWNNIINFIYPTIIKKNILEAEKKKLEFSKKNKMVNFFKDDIVYLERSRENKSEPYFIGPLKIKEVSRNKLCTLVGKEENLTLFSHIPFNKLKLFKGNKEKIQLLDENNIEEENEDCIISKENEIMEESIAEGKKPKNVRKVKRLNYKVLNSYGK